MDTQANTPPDPNTQNPDPDEKTDPEYKTPKPSAGESKDNPKKPDHQNPNHANDNNEDLELKLDPLFEKLVNRSIEKHGHRIEGDYLIVNVSPGDDSWSFEDLFYSTAHADSGVVAEPKAPSIRASLENTELKIIRSSSQIEQAAIEGRLLQLALRGTKVFAKVAPRSIPLLNLVVTALELHKYGKSHNWDLDRITQDLKEKASDIADVAAHKAQELLDRILIFKKSIDKTKHKEDTKQKTSTSLPTQEPDDNDGEKDEKRKYRKADYHSKRGKYEKWEGKEGKNPEPHDPQKLLDKSEKIKPTSDRRIAVDYENQEFGIFDREAGNTYHGHARKWSELSGEQKAFAIKRGWVKHTGKIKN